MNRYIFLSLFICFGLTNVNSSPVIGANNLSLIESIPKKPMNDCITKLEALGVDPKIENPDSKENTCRSSAQHIVIQSETKLSTSRTHYMVYRGPLTSSYPMIVSLYRSDPRTKIGTAYCTGIIVSKRALLTAAHCEVKPGDYIFSEIIDLFDPKVFYYRVSAIKTPRHDDAIFKKMDLSNEYGVDIAIVFSDEQFDSSIGAAPIFGLSKLDKNPDYHLFGYGISDSSLVLGSVKRKGIVKIIDADYYQPQKSVGNERMGVELKPTLDREFIAANLKTGTNGCNGDSGGPLILRQSEKKWGVVGLVSRSPDPYTDCSTPKVNKKGSIYSKVSMYRDFLNSNGVKYETFTPSK